jgi:hypothetical protein
VGEAAEAARVVADKASSVASACMNRVLWVERRGRGPGRRAPARHGDVAGAAGAEAGEVGGAVGGEVAF